MDNKVLSMTEKDSFIVVRWCNRLRSFYFSPRSIWEHTAYQEFIETKQRYRIVNIERLLEVLDFDSDDIEGFRKWYKLTLD